MQQEQGADPQVRLNTLSRTVVRGLMNSKTLRDKGVPSSREEEEAVRNPDVRKFVRYAQDEFWHLLKGPLQKAGGGLPGSIAELEERSPLITHMIGMVEQGRISTFTRLTPNETSGTLLHSYVPDAFDPTQAETVPQPETEKGILERFGFRMVDQKETEGKTTQLYEMPDAPSLPQTRILLLQSGHLGDAQGIVVAVNKDRYDPTTKDRIETRVVQADDGSQVTYLKVRFSPGGDATEITLIDKKMDNGVLRRDFVWPPKESRVGTMMVNLPPEVLHDGSATSYLRLNHGRQVDMDRIIDKVPRTVDIFELGMPQVEGRQYPAVPDYFDTSAPILKAMVLKDASGKNGSVLIINSSDRKDAFVEVAPID